MHLLYATVAYLMNRNVRRSGTARTAVSPVKREGVSQVSLGCAKKNKQRRAEPPRRHSVTEGLASSTKGCRER